MGCRGSLGCTSTVKGLFRIEHIPWQMISSVPKRSSCYKSGLNIIEDTSRFLRFVVWLMLAKDDIQGLREQPTAIGGRSIRFFSPGECKIPSPFVRARVDMVMTRGTTVWPVELQNEQSTAEKNIEDQQL